MFVPYAHAADFVIVAGRFGDAPDDISFFVVERNTPGVSVRALKNLDLTRRLDTVELSNVRVAPSAEVLDVQVANRENAWGVRQIPADLRPPLHPTIKSRSKEQEGSFGHVLMLEGEVRPDDFKLLAEPALEIRRGFEDVHGADLLRRGRARSSLCP